jgi:hypothetical protein
VDYRDPKWQEAAERMIQMGTSFDARPSRIYLQDHGDPVRYRNIRLRSLAAR